MKTEIAIKGLEKERRKNPHNINEIVLKKDDNGPYQIVLKCKNSNNLEDLGSEISRMCDMLDDGDYTPNRDYGFSLSYDSPPENVILEGDISKAVKALIKKGIIGGTIEKIFKDEQDEEDIVNFLKESEKSSHQASNIENKNDIKNANRSKKSCNIM